MCQSRDSMGMSPSYQSKVLFLTRPTSPESNLPGQSIIFPGIFSVNCIRTVYAKLSLNVDSFLYLGRKKLTALLIAVGLCNNLLTRNIKKNTLDLGFITQRLKIEITMTKTFLNGDLFHSKFVSKLG